MSEDEAMSSTPLSAGPTQGVQAKLKVKPKTRAVIGFMRQRSRCRGSRCSRARRPFSPSSPNCTRPKRIIITPLIRTSQTLWLPSARPAAVKPKPSRKNAKLTPSTKNSVPSKILRRG